jgi:hypothetical protein
MTASLQLVIDCAGVLLPPVGDPEVGPEPL